jgi:dienelactone hydrolase
MSVKSTVSCWVLLVLGFPMLQDASSEEADAYAVVRDHLRPAETAENVTSVSDRGQSYAVRLPSGYVPDHGWPVLLLMDPRGRAMVPLERFEDAADRRGYVLVSSYNTASDTGKDFNSPAVKAMITDAPHLFSVAKGRFYLVGFSGTARTAWTFAQMYENDVAGLIAFGGGLPLGQSAPWQATFSYYGAAGDLDFNFDEMIRLDRNLDLRDMRHTFESFDGRHQWGPPETCARSVDWMELTAMKQGLRPVDDGLVEQLYHDRRKAAGDVAVDRPYHAYLLLEAMRKDFQDLVTDAEISEVESLATRLESNPEVVRAREAQEEAVDRYYRYKKHFADLLDAVDTETPPDALTMIAELEIPSLERQANASFDDEAGAIEARSVQRLLEVVYVQCTFYLPPDYIRDGRAWAAVLALEVADAVRRLDLPTFLDVHGLGSLRDEPAYRDWIARRAKAGY